MAEDNLAVLIMSCDQYSDLWPSFFYYFWNYWPNCPYPVFLGSTTKTYADDRIKTLLAQHDESWSDSALRYLEQIANDYVLLLQEDFFLEKEINSADIGSCVMAMKELGAKYCRLVPGGERLDNIGGCEQFGWIRPSNAFRISTQASIWYRESLMQHIRSSESPWDFEILGSERTRSSANGYLSTKWPVFKYDGHGALVRGKWTRSGARMARRAGHMILERPHLSLVPNFTLFLQRKAFWLVLRISPRLIRRWNLRQTRIRHSDLA